MRLEDLEGKSVSCYVEELNFQILVDQLFCNSQAASIIEGIATRACSANGCFSSGMAGLVFGKDICAFTFGNTSVRFYFIKEDVGLRVTDGIREDFEDVSSDMVTVLFWVQQLFPNLME